MSDLNPYESKIPDLKLNPFLPHHEPTHGQAADRDNAEPCYTDRDTVSSGQNENTQHFATSTLKGLKIDQAGMVWGSNGVLLGKVRDDNLADSEELEGYPLNEKSEAFDEYGQIKGQFKEQALAHETSPPTKFRGVREHPFYKVRPDRNGRYYCPYTASGDCWYGPQRLKSKFDEHLDTHLWPYRCNFDGCKDTPFCSTNSLLRHESEVHKMQEHGAKSHLHSYNAFEPPEAKTKPSVSKSPFDEDAATVKVHDTSKGPHVRGFQKYQENGFEPGAHVVAPPFPFHGRTPSMKSNDNVKPKWSDFVDMAHESKHTVTPGPWYDPKLASIPTSINSDQPKVEDKNVVVGIDLLHKLESKISDLESRVEECEGRSSSSSNSSISDSEDSVDSVSDIDNRSVQETWVSPPRQDDDISIFGPEVKQERRSAVNINEPSLTVALLKCFGESERFKLIEEEQLSSRHVGNKPLLTLVEEHCSNGKLWRRRLEIASPAFYELLREVSRHNLNDIALSHAGVLHITEPFMVLFLNRKQLADYVDNTTNANQAKEHAKFILNYLKSDFSDVSRMIDNFESVTPPNLVKYCDLWMLYRPGTTVYSRANGEWEAFTIDCLDGMQIRKPSPDNHHALTRLDISAWSINFDGEVYGRVWSLHCVAPFHGVRDISSLPLIPEKFLVDGKTVRESLLSRGKKFCSVQEQHCQTSEISSSQSHRVMVDHLTYQRRNGWLISIDGKYGPSSAKERSWKDNRYSDWDTSAEAIDRRPRRYTPQRSIVRHFENEYCNRDYELESIDKPEDTQAEACRSYSIDRPLHVVVSEFEKYNVIRSDAEMDELSLILCPQHVRGFCFQDKVWKFLNVSQLTPVSFQEKAWDRLVLDEEYKDVIETMVSSHVDKVAGLRGSASGKGLSILLHGEPGVGKTLTAESIAEHFGKPLFPVACSDIGTSLPKADEKLEEISDYATKWGAILLFDEADVLLQARRDYECANLKRNDLVSSFVRLIEYYPGIVFITTNRVSRFDGALLPRIDVTLGLPPLDRGRRVAIWHNQIQDLFNAGAINAAQSADLCMLATEKWSKDDINGHQIKKMVNTARVLAEKKGKMVGHRQIETMLKIEREFGERIGHVEKERDKEKEKENEKKAGGKKDKEDLEGFEQVEKP